MLASLSFDFLVLKTYMSIRDDCYNAPVNQKTQQKTASICSSSVKRLHEVSTTFNLFSSQVTFMVMATTCKRSGS